MYGCSEPKGTVPSYLLVLSVYAACSDVWSEHCVLCRYDFIEFIRNGGRRPHAQPDPLTRQGSIELVSEASDAGQTEQQPPPPTHVHPGADPLQPRDNAEGMTGDHMEAALGFKPSDRQQQHQLGLQTKLAPLQTAVVFCSWAATFCNASAQLQATCCVTSVAD